MAEQMIREKDVEGVGSNTNNRPATTGQARKYWKPITRQAMKYQKLITGGLENIEINLNTSFPPSLFRTSFACPIF